MCKTVLEQSLRCRRIQKLFTAAKRDTSDYALRAQSLTETQRGNLAQIFSVDSDQATVASLNEIGPTIGVAAPQQSDRSRI